MTNVVQVTHAQIPAWRLRRLRQRQRQRRRRRQSLAPHTTAAPEELAERLAGVQAQVPSAAEPALATRRTEPAADAARVAGSVVGTWGMRGTLHLLAAAAYLALLGAVRTWGKPSWQRAFGVSPRQMEALGEAVDKALDRRLPTRRG
ncbi:MULTISPECIES: DNA glycosylase AlkZ-like family protein [Streptomyces]|uniref:DNA glycosylase AlkZ-like family protein n=1 Tax=Streptomyces TaxID=1883 RepID=UPI000B9E97A8|nr:crosslink repair DNA glycosylase YcaQ family protein [Streptomyces kasugaensis]